MGRLRVHRREEAVSGVTCERCGGRIDPGAYEVRARMCKTLRKEFTPPRFCSECSLLLVLRAVYEEDEEVAKIGRP